MKSKLISAVALLALVFGLTGLSVAVAQGGEDPAQVTAGEAVYNGSCAGCHGADGTGSDRGRPLTGIAGQQPDRTVHIASVTDGKGGMPAFGGNLSDDEIDAAVAYVRATFVADATTELPRTGSEPNLVLLGGGVLMALGLGALLVTRQPARQAS